MVNGSSVLTMFHRGSCPNQEAPLKLASGYSPNVSITTHGSFHTTDQKTVLQVQVFHLLHVVFNSISMQKIFHKDIYHL